jgi:hypothetical protein
MAETRNQKAPKTEYPASVDRPLAAELDMAAKVASASAGSNHGWLRELIARWTGH